MEFPLLQDIVILLGFSVLVVLLLQRLKLPSILGFLLTGIIIGPYGLSLIEAVHEVEILAEIGVILLLFVIGMELSIQQLKSMRKTVFYGGFLQVGLTVAVTAVVYMFLGFEWNEAVFVGFLFSLSSTAIVLKILGDKNEITAPHGRNALGILIFQDIIVVPMMLFTPMLAGQSTDIGMEILELVIKSAVVIALTFVLAKYVVPRLMLEIARTKSKELFLLTTITICFAVAFLTAEAGLSLAFGAFLAGLVISESDYSHQATSTILPFRELFTSFFFISIGMLLDLDFFFKNVGIILLLVLVVFLVKGTIAGLSTIFFRYPPRTVVLTGLALFQIGEFAFILSRVGINYDLLTPLMNQYFLSVSIVTMLVTPFILIYSEQISKWIMKSQKPDQVPAVQVENSEGLENHLLIIGYGINGRNLAKAAKYANIPYVILELNADTVKEEKAKGEPIYFGDAIHEHILESVKVQRSRVVVIAISDPVATKAIITNVRHLSKSVFIVVRTRYVKEIEALLALGADEVIPEEFETSIEIFSRVLHNYLIPIDELEKLVETVRADNYNIFQAKSKAPNTITSNKIPDFNITSVRLLTDSGIVGKSLEEADVRKRFGVNVLAIGRDGNIITSLNPKEKFLREDMVYISGDQEHIENFFQMVS